MMLGLGLGLCRQQRLLLSAGQNNLFAFLAGDSTEEHHFTHYSGAGETALEAAAATYFEGTVDAVDAARSGSYLLESAALSVSTGNVNLFWVDDGGALADGPQLTNNVVGIAGEPNIYALSLGINDHTETVVAGLTAADYRDGYDYFVNRVEAIHGCNTMINTLSRDTGGDDDGANAVFEGMLDAMALNNKALRGVDVYDLDLVDAKHHTQAAQEIKAEREAQQMAFYLGNSTTQALGPKVVGAVLKTDVIEINLQHIGGSDIVAPLVGAGGFDAMDDGTVIGADLLERIDASTAALTLSEGGAPVQGSEVRLYTPYGANGNGLASAGADVMKDNSAMALPVQRDIITCVNGDPLQQLDNLALYFDARGSVKAMPVANEVDAVDAIAGSVASVSEIDAGDHFVFDAAAFGGVGGLKYQSLTQMIYTGFAAGSTHTIGMVIENSNPADSGDILFFANSGGSTDNQAKIIVSGNNKMYWSLNEDNTSSEMSGVMGDGQQMIMLFEFVDNDVLNVYIDGATAPDFTLNPRDDFASWNSILLGARTAGAESGAYEGFTLGAYFHTTDVLSPVEKQEVTEYWSKRFGLS